MWDSDHEPVNWSVDSNDWASGAWNLPGMIYDAGSGPIILQHDRNFDWSAQDKALKNARSMGYHMVTLSECLGGKSNIIEENKPAIQKPKRRPVTRTPVNIKPPIVKKP